MALRENNIIQYDITQNIVIQYDTIRCINATSNLTRFCVRIRVRFSFSVVAMCNCLIVLAICIALQYNVQRWTSFSGANLQDPSKFTAIYVICRGIPEYRGVKKLGERQIIHRWNRNDV